ncbi:lipopolysaccharide biosynthesis protein [Sphingomonas dokdonensis]|uniref:Polysaccharide biosynthesis protein n=1 Tax=Sphingomonas dokdonensis TaxID=344880 RepID=A0A2D0A4L0_9SPHN|nr:oligosaccharide flippase family protein [Sphingomonas dokdonensis]OWK27831.1 polysaccharide biosynthesis protein [Sphingomonas dokdonensis]
MASVFASRMGGILVSLIFIPIYTRLLSPAEFGAVALLLSLQAFFLVSDLGLATILARDTAIARGDQVALAAATQDRRRGEMMVAVLVMLVALVALVVIALGGGPDILRDGIRTIVSTALVALLVLLNISQLCLNALGHYRLTGLLTTSGTLARAAVSAIVLARVEASVDAFLWSQFFVAALHYATTRAALDQRSGAVPHNLAQLLDRAALIRLLVRCKPVMVYTLGGAAALNLDKTILATLLPIRLTGWYFLAATYAMVPIGILSGPLNQYFAPRVAHAEASGDTAARWRLAAAFQLLLLPAVVLPAFILIREAPLLIPLWLHGTPNAPQIASLATILLAGTAVGATGYYPTTFLIAVADNRFLARLSAISAVIVLGVAAAWAAAGSLIGVAASYAIFHACGCIVQWWRLRQHWSRIQYRTFLLTCYLMPAAAMLLVCLIGWALAGMFATGWARAAIEATVQLLLGGGAMAILSRWCYRRSASLHRPILA